MSAATCWWKSFLASTELLIVGWSSSTVSPKFLNAMKFPMGKGWFKSSSRRSHAQSLGEIRRMPGRRVVGDRAQAFVRNPFATLGPDASKVIDPEQFRRPGTTQAYRSPVSLRGFRGMRRAIPMKWP